MFATDNASVYSYTAGAVTVKLNGKEVALPAPDSSGGVLVRLSKP